MNRALWLLWFLRTRGFLRRLVSWRGAFLVLLVMGFAAFVFLPGFFIRDEVSPHLLMPFIALLLIVAFFPALLWGREAPVWTFWPAEVDQLFAAPLSRREILLYRHLNAVLALVIYALLGAVWFSHAIRSYWEAFAALFILGLLLSAMLQLLAQLLLTLWQWNRMAWRAAVWAGLAFLLFGIWEVVDAYRQPGALAGLRAEDLGMLAAVLRETYFASILLLPLLPVELMVGAADLAGFFGGLAGGIAMYLTILGTALWLDRDFRMPGYLRSDRWEVGMQNLRQGSEAVIGPRRRSSHHRILFPFWGGFGPLAWCELVRQRELVRRFSLVLLCFVGILVMLRYATGGRADLLVLFIWSWSSLFFCTGGGMVNSVEPYVALPIGSAAIAFGLVLPAAVRDFLLLAAATAGLGLWLDHLAWALILASFLLPINILFKAVGQGCGLLFQPWWGRDAVRATWNVLLVMVIHGIVFLSAAALALAVFLWANLVTDSLMFLWLAPWMTAVAVAFALVWVLAVSIDSRAHRVSPRRRIAGRAAV